MLVTTSDLRGAGTDANVTMTLFGDKGDSGDRKLDSSQNDFERGKVWESMGKDTVRVCFIGASMLLRILAALMQGKKVLCAFSCSQTDTFFFECADVGVFQSVSA